MSIHAHMIYTQSHNALTLACNLSCKCTRQLQPLCKNSTSMNNTVFYVPTSISVTCAEYHLPEGSMAQLCQNFLCGMRNAQVTTNVLPLLRYYQN